MLDRVDIVWDENRAWGGVADKVPDAASDATFKDHVTMCIFQDKVALQSLDLIPVETLTYEVDYPHSRFDVSALQGAGRAAHGRAHPGQRST